MDLAALLNTITAALLLGAGALLLECRTMCAVHAQRLADHDADIKRLQDKPPCPHV